MKTGWVCNLSGNVWEWENSCRGDGFSDGCRLRGGYTAVGKRTFGVILVMKTSVPVEMSALVFVAVHFRDGSSVILC
ncbi:MAG: hypothetical protein BWY17_01347 [Deltaproteobacteria bacterium ADurb.Bin207]|jgi:hypothetical protein|nr:MAG: hypothetical protein BWY17_01347 [Deltaproteobacteria bacterium ADurb.Bin207]